MMSDTLFWMIVFFVAQWIVYSIYGCIDALRLNKISPNMTLGEKFIECVDTILGAGIGASLVTGLVTLVLGALGVKF